MVQQASMRPPQNAGEDLSYKRKLAKIPHKLQ